MTKVRVLFTDGGMVTFHRHFASVKTLYTFIGTLNAASYVVGVWVD